VLEILQEGGEPLEERAGWKAPTPFGAGLDEA
jgi:hypothetical protein